MFSCLDQKPSVVNKKHLGNSIRRKGFFYTYNKKELNRVIARIRYLTKRLDELQVVDRLPANTDKVFFGAYVSLKDDEGETLQIRIVGHDELDTQKRWISIDAPMAKALLGKEVDDDVTVLTPNGETFYTVTAIHYDTPSGP